MVLGQPTIGNDGFSMVGHHWSNDGMVIYHRWSLTGTVHSVGVASTLWKLLQISGRLGRGAGENAIFITVAPKKHTMRGRHFECGVVMIYIDHQTLSLTYREGRGQACQGIVCLTRHLHQQGSLWPIWNPESWRWENSAHVPQIIKASEMLVAPRISEFFGLL